MNSTGNVGIAVEDDLEVSGFTGISPLGGMDMKQMVEKMQKLEIKLAVMDQSASSIMLGWQMGEKFGKIEKEMANLREENEKLKEKMVGKDRALNEVKNEMAKLKEEFSKENGNLKDEIARIKEQMAEKCALEEMGNGIDTLGEEGKKLKKEMNELKWEITKMIEESGKMKSEIADLKDEMDENKQELEEKMKAPKETAKSTDVPTSNPAAPNQKFPAPIYPTQSFSANSALPCPMFPAQNLDSTIPPSTFSGLTFPAQNPNFSFQHHFMPHHHQPYH